MSPTSRNFGRSRASSREEVSITVARIGEAVQPTGARVATLLADASATFTGKVQGLLEQAAAATVRAFEKQSADLLIILLTPASMIALVFALWRFSADLGWTGSFVISDGLFSHWQVWMALAVVLKVATSSLQGRMRAGSKTSADN